MPVHGRATLIWQKMNPENGRLKACFLGIVKIQQLGGGNTGFFPLTG